MIAILNVEDEPDIQAVAKPALEMVGGLRSLSAVPARRLWRGCFGAAGNDPDGCDDAGDGWFNDAGDGVREQPGASEIPAVFMTAKVQPDEVAYNKSLGAVGVIAKPFDPMTFV